MTPILFYGVPSGCSFGSIVALEWLGAPYRLCRIQMPEEVSGDAFKRINPAGETPALLTADGRAFSESAAILHHINTLGIERGLGFAQGSADFDRFNQVLGFLNTTFFSSFASLWYVLEHDTDADARRVLTDYGRARVQRAHALLETMLGDRPWLVGDRPGIADAYFAGLARWTAYHDVVNRADFPRLQRLFEKVEAEPAVQFAHAIEQQREAKSTGGFLGEMAFEDALGALKIAA